jgi:hypothetical protein
VAGRSGITDATLRFAKSPLLGVPVAANCCHIVSNVSGTIQCTSTSSPHKQLFYKVQVINYIRGLFPSNGLSAEECRDSTLKGTTTTSLHFIVIISLSSYRGAGASQSLQKLGHGLEDRGSGVRFPAGTGNFSLHHRVQNGSGAHPASYPVGAKDSFPGGKAAGS